MSKNTKILLFVIIFGSLLALGVWINMFYPTSIMPVGQLVEVLTPDSMKYHNDCLHPCVYLDKKNNCYYMVQSPWYQSKDSIENPIFYQSMEFRSWTDGYVLAQTPAYGYNLDPNLFLDKKGDVYCIWREVNTPHCDSLNVQTALRGGKLDGNQVREVYDYAYSYDASVGTEIAPVILQRPNDEHYYIYCCWYQRTNPRQNKGLAIWSGTQLDNPDFKLIDTLPIQSTHTVDKWKQMKMGSILLFIPQRKWHDIWHFDLFEYRGVLYMISCGEMDDNIMLSKSDDWVHFTTYRIPLVNAHHVESRIGERLFLYKPTAFLQNDTLHLYYTGNMQNSTENWRNKLYYTSMPMSEILNRLE